MTCKYKGHLGTIQALGLDYEGWISGGANARQSSVIFEIVSSLGTGGERFDLKSPQGATQGSTQMHQHVIPFARVVLAE